MVYFPSLLSEILEILTSSTFLHLGIAQARLALRSTSGTPEITFSRYFFGGIN